MEVEEHESQCVKEGIEDPFCEITVPSPSNIPWLTKEQNKKHLLLSYTHFAFSLLPSLGCFCFHGRPKQGYKNKNRHNKAIGFGEKSLLPIVLEPDIEISLAL